MGTPKKYGLKRTNPRLQMDMRWQKKQHQRNRERAKPSLVAGKTTKKEAQENGV